jgi:hypothetical protein
LAAAVVGGGSSSGIDVCDAVRRLADVGQSSFDLSRDAVAVLKPVLNLGAMFSANNASRKAPRRAA